MISGDWDAQCPDCGLQEIPGKCGTFIAPCGMTWEEHREMRDLRKEAERRAHQLVMEAKKRDLLPQAILKAIYDETERDIRRNADRGHGG